MRNQNKKLLVIPFIALISIQTTGQVNNVERIFSAKVSFNRYAVAYENPISKRFVINNELSLSEGFGNYWIFGENWLLKPSIRIEQRYYYNFLRRQVAKKITTNNSANYFAFAVDIQPGFSTINNPDNVYSISFVPKWGLRRTIKGKGFFEFAFGYGLNFPQNKKIIGAIVFDFQIGLRFNKLTKK